MSKQIDQLTPDDFGKSFDSDLFSKWKESVTAHEKASVVGIALLFVGIAAMILLGGLVGLSSFFLLAIAANFCMWPKKKKRKGFERELGINNNDVRAAIIQCRGRMKI